MAEPPVPLGAYGRARWDLITAEFDFSAATDLDLLAQYCASLDVIAALDAIIAEQPTMVHSPSAGQVVNRAITEKRAQVQLIQRLAAQLALESADDSGDVLPATAISAAARRAANARWAKRRGA